MATLIQRSRRFRFALPLLAPLLLGLTPVDAVDAADAVGFRAGAAIVDVTPREFPVLINGGMRSRSSETVKAPIHARSLAFTDGDETLVIVVVDSCMMPRDLLDRAKALASEKSGIPTEHMLVSATHTHTAPSCMGLLGTDADPVYSLFLQKRLVDAILAPLADLRPARIGWGEIDAADYTALRRWVIAPGHEREDPFGNPTVRANMHAGTDWEKSIGPTGPEDPVLGIIAVESLEGEPIGFLANFSMHYYGDRDISPDYFGPFSDLIKERLAPDDDRFVAMMSHGCSGDIWRHDYEKSPNRGEDQLGLEQYAAELAELALEAHAAIEYERPESIRMAERRLHLDYRTPDVQRLEWARRIVEEMGDRIPEDTTEVYAREAVILHELQSTDIVVQGLRLGENIAIATTPNETYAITGLKIKAASPVPQTMVIELANGGDGYIPPPEQHLLGGYNTWPARSAGLEIMAEPKITETAIALLEEVSGLPRRIPAAPDSAAARAILESRPQAYWRLDEFAGPFAIDASGHERHALYEPRVLFHLPGHGDFSDGDHLNRSAHFAGDRLRAELAGLGADYAVTLHFWNGMPTSARGTAGWIFSRGRDHALGASGDHLGIGGSSAHAGNLVFFHGPDPEDLVAGATVIERWRWYRLDFKREGSRITVHLDGELEIDAEAPASFPAGLTTLFFGGRSDGIDNFEGRLDEIAVYY